MTKQHDLEKDQESIILEVRKFPDPAEIEAVIDQVPGLAETSSIGVDETLDNMSPTNRQPAQESMQLSDVMSQPPNPLDRYGEPLTLENIAKAVVDELERRGYLPQQDGE